MLVFAGHHIESQGAVNDVSTELIEASILGALISVDNNSVFVGSTKIKDKINIINTYCDSLNIDIHFTTSSGGYHGPKVYYKDNCIRSKKAAHIIQTELNLVTYSDNKPELGYYHNKKECGMDLFLINNRPSIIICPENWDNYTKIILNRANYANAIQTGIRKLINQKD